MHWTTALRKARRCLLSIITGFPQPLSNYDAWAFTLINRLLNHHQKPRTSECVKCCWTRSAYLRSVNFYRIVMQSRLSKLNSATLRSVGGNENANDPSIITVVLINCYQYDLNVKCCPNWCWKYNKVPCQSVCWRCILAHISPVPTNTCNNMHSYNIAAKQRSAQCQLKLNITEVFIHCVSKTPHPCYILKHSNNLGSLWTNFTDQC